MSRTRAGVDDVFAALYDGSDGVLELRAFSSDKSAPAVAQAFIPPTDAGARAGFIEKYAAQDLDLYFGVATRMEKHGVLKGDLEHCHQLPALFTDIDFKVTAEADARKRLSEFWLPPSLVVHSGGGWHAYWRLKEPLEFPADEPLARSLLRRLGTALGGDMVAAEPTRVLRIPGTLNQKREYGAPRPVTIVHDDLERAYNPTDFDDVLPPDPMPTSTRFTVPDVVREGEGRNLTMYTTARTLKLMGLGEASIIAALSTENARVCIPPLPEAAITRIVRQAMAQADRPRPNGSVPAPISAGTPSATAPVEAAVLRVPEAAMLGLAHDFATLYARYLESPVSFFYFVFLTYFGALIASKATLASALTPEPRLYTVIVGESADTRKSTALIKTDQFFESLGQKPSVHYGAGSAEGIAAELKECPTLLLHFDELKSFVDKAKNENSVLLPLVSTLFERGDYDNRVKAEKVSVRGASLSLVAACTTDTFSSMWGPQFLAIGFPNRLWLVTDKSTQRYAIPDPSPRTRLSASRRASERPSPTSTTPTRGTVCARWPTRSRRRPGPCSTRGTRPAKARSSSAGSTRTGTGSWSCSPRPRGAPRSMVMWRRPSSPSCATSSTCAASSIPWTPRAPLPLLRSAFVGRSPEGPSRAVDSTDSSADVTRTATASGRGTPPWSTSSARTNSS